MISDIVGALFWGAFFWATFPWMMIFAGGAAHAHHVGGRGGYVRDFYLTMSPMMPGGVAIYFGGTHGEGWPADWAVWAAVVAITVAGATLFLAPPIRNARARLRTANVAAQASWSSGGDDDRATAPNDSDR